MNPSARRLCVTVTASTVEDLRQRRDRAFACDGADLVELRLDTLQRIDIAGALAGRPGPVVVTCRPVWEGGHFAGSEEERRRILTEAVRSDADWVDVEWQARFDDLIEARGGRGIILSAHDFQGANFSRLPSRRRRWPTAWLSKRWRQHSVRAAGC
jgi:3-dehydroquinate dehydratase-1